MAYSVKEMFYTLQGEGVHAGRAAVFLRFSGCNLWSGREQDRATAVCDFCDTDFVGTDGQGGGRFDTELELAYAAAKCWGGLMPVRGERMLLVCTGGEPLLQLDQLAVDALHGVGFEIAVETNGTIKPPPGIDWLCVSPKGKAKVVVSGGDELKLVYPQAGVAPEPFLSLNFRNFRLQPLSVADDPVASAENLQATVRYCISNPQWRFGLQMHKIIGVD